MNSFDNFDDNKENATTVHNSKKELDKYRAGKTYAKITVEDIEKTDEFWENISKDDLKMVYNYREENPIFIEKTHEIKNYRQK